MKAEPGRILDLARQWPPTLRMLLLFGGDDSANRELAGQIVPLVAADETVNLEGAALKGDPQALAAAVNSLSMFGERQLVRIDGLDDGGLAAVEALLAAPAGHPVLALAGDLKAGSKLRKLAESSPAIAACIQYEASARDAGRLAADMAGPMGLRLARGVAEQLFAMADGDRLVMRRELEKYALYKDAAPDRPATLEPEDIEALGIATGEAALFAPVIAITTGDLPQATDLLARLPEGTAIPLLRAMARRLELLISLRSEVDAGQRPADVVKAQGKAIFWKEAPAISTALALWTMPRLQQALGEMLTAERAIKAAGGIGDLGAHAALLAVARRAAALARRR